MTPRASGRQCGAPWTSLRLDGGMSANDWIAQDMADMLDIAVERPADVETTARGAAMLAALGAGLHGSIEAAVAQLPGRQRFAPAMDAPVRADRLKAWGALLAASERALP